MGRSEPHQGPANEITYPRGEARQLPQLGLFDLDRPRDSVTPGGRGAESRWNAADWRASHRFPQRFVAAVRGSPGRRSP
jgi:hypothetical protein